MSMQLYLTLISIPIGRIYLYHVDTIANHMVSAHVLFFSAFPPCGDTFFKVYGFCCLNSRQHSEKLNLEDYNDNQQRTPFLSNSHVVFKVHNGVKILGHLVRSIFLNNMNFDGRLQAFFFRPPDPPGSGEDCSMWKVQLTHFRHCLTRLHFCQSFVRNDHSIYLCSFLNV